MPRKPNKQNVEHLNRCLALPTVTPPAEKTAEEIRTEFDAVISTARKRWWQQGYEAGYAEAIRGSNVDG